MTVVVEARVLAGPRALALFGLGQPRMGRSCSYLGMQEVVPQFSSSCEGTAVQLSHGQGSGSVWSAQAEGGRFGKVWGRKHQLEVREQVDGSGEPRVTVLGAGGRQGFSRS